jgi:uncharacterized protein YecE (DUF72 family)
VFYPPGLPQKAELGYYAERFGTVELNNTFYRLPTQAAVAGWAARVPPGFLFAVKGSRYLTHIKRLKDTGVGISRFFEAIRPLGEHRGPVLWQLPPQMKPDVGRLSAFLEALPPGSDAVVELRNEDWYRDEVFEALEQHGASLCLHDLVDAQAPFPPPGPLYYRRFHGTMGAYGGRYGRAGLRGAVAEVAAMARAGRPCFAYFNNDVGGAAIVDAATLLAMLEELLGPSPAGAEAPQLS